MNVQKGIFRTKLKKFRIPERNTLKTVHSLWSIFGHSLLMNAKAIGFSNLKLIANIQFKPALEPTTSYLLACALITNHSRKDMYTCFVLK